MRVLRSHAVCEFVQIRLAENDGACATQFPNHGGIVGRQEIAQDERAHGRAEISRLNIVFQCHRDAVKNSAAFPAKQFPFRRARFRERALGSHRQKSIQLRIEPLDAR